MEESKEKVSMSEEKGKISDEKILLDEWVGLGLYTDKACRKEMKEDEFNYLTLLGTDADKHIRYYITVCARREKDGFKNSKAWFDYLRLWKTELDSPCTVSIR